MPCLLAPATPCNRRANRAILNAAAPTANGQRADHLGPLSRLRRSKLRGGNADGDAKQRDGQDRQSDQAGDVAPSAARTRAT
jgi:hypothetical protein